MEAGAVRTEKRTTGKHVTTMKRERSQKLEGL